MTFVVFRRYFLHAICRTENGAISRQKWLADQPGLAAVAGEAVVVGVPVAVVVSHLA